MNLIIGSHVSFLKEDGLLGSVKESLSYKSNTFMFYTGSNQSTLRNPIDDETTYLGHKLMKENNIDPSNVMVHAPFIINLANNEDKRKYDFYISFLIQELNRVKTLGFNNLVLHPGSAVKIDRKEAIKNICYGINTSFEKVKDVNILLEYMSGKGTEVGINIDELSSIIEGIEDKSRIYICLDTCHMNDSGIDLNNINEFLDEFDKKIGIDKIKCVHFNDSLNPVGGHKDRHANIGKGTIGINTLINVISSSRLKNIPFILETPYINNIPPYKEEIKLIRDMVKDL